MGIRRTLFSKSGYSVRHRAIPESAADTERLEAYIIEEIPRNQGE